MSIKYVAQVEHVREASLVGVADAAFWRTHAAAEGLTIDERGGRAQVMLSATQGRFRGVTFRELSTCVAVHSAGADEPAGWFMVHAFNSLRLFAWIERTMFSTPYFPGRIQVRAELPALLEADDGVGSLRAAMDGRTSGVAVPAAASRPTLRNGREGFEGWIYLPASGRRNRGGRKRFYAKISGETQVYAFDVQRDEVRTTPSDRSPVFAWLAESGFTGVEWQLRADASHAKSKTYNWGESRT